MGEVYRARDTRLNRDVAVKVLPRSFAEDQERLRRFTLEAQSAGALNHPNILAIYDIGTQDSLPYIVSELLEGEALRERLAGGKLSVGKAVDYARQIASGLAAAHTKGITHRDIKPENLFITRDGRVKILDFGLAKLTQPEVPSGTAATLAAGTEPGLVMGTLGYMSPEQVRGRPADARSDIFSFGAVFYEMLTGARAFRGESAVETMNAILKDEPAEAPAGTPLLLERIARHCLEKDPDQRFQAAGDIGFALESLSQAAGPALPVAEKQTAAAGKWLRWALAGVVVACALTGVISFLAGARSERRPSPTFRRLTFRHGVVGSARFAPDGNTLVYSASWDGDPTQIFSIRLDSPEYHPPVVPGASLLSVSAAGELALLLEPRTVAFTTIGTLARVPFSGGAPREVLEKVEWADWSPNGEPAIVRQGEKGNQLEFPVGKVLFRTAGFVSNPRFSPAGDRIGFIHHPRSNDDSGEVAVVDLAGQVRTLSRQWGSAWGLAWMPPTGEIWFTAAPGGSKRELLAVSLSGVQRTILPQTGNLTLEDISRSGRVLLNSLSQQMKLRFVGPEGKERDLSWLDWSLGTGIAADGSAVVFFESGEGAGEKAVSYYRKTDGSPAVKLGNISRPRLSPDGKAVVGLDSQEVELAVVPIGPGEARRLPLPGLTVGFVEWQRDARGVVLLGNEAGHGLRLYVMDLGGGKPRPITAEGVAAGTPLVSPDGKFVTAVQASGQVILVPLAGGDPVICQGMEVGERPSAWTADGTALYVTRRGTLPARVYVVNWQTGRRELWKEVTPRDAAGVPDIGGIHVTPDGKSYAYSYRQTLSQLHLVEGLR
jgi:dipeptidyl aminopeptidase/acylaminoacyl peptidase